MLRARRRIHIPALLTFLLVLAGVGLPIGLPAGLPSAVAAGEATLSGQVLGEDGRVPSTHTSVRVQQLVGGEWTGAGPFGGSSTTDSSGRYSVTLPAGSYRIEFEQLDHVTQHQPVTLAAGEQRTLDVVLDRGAAISGKVVLPPDGPRTNAFVRVYARSPFGQGSGWQQVDYAYVEPSGVYSASGFPGGTYRVGVAPQDTHYPAEYYDNVTAVEDALDLTVAGDGTVTGIDFDLGTAPVAPATAPLPEVTTSKTPKLTGKPRVGKRLKVRLGDVSPMTATVRYRWFADQDRLRQAKGPALRLTRRHLGRKITVKVVVRAPGHLKHRSRLTTATRVRR